MDAKLKDIAFYRELESSLATSTEEQRKVWANKIIADSVDIKHLSGLLGLDNKTSTRFLWLLGRIGMTDAKTLFNKLPFLWNTCNRLNPVYKQAFANYWLMSGVPPENEGEAIDILFKWLLSNDINVTIKSRSLSVLLKLTKKYPELKNELRLCLEDQVDKHSKEFKRKVAKTLAEMEVSS